MSDPLALVSLAVAAAGGRIADHAAPALVAAGHALLQRCAPLVRALAGRRAALVLPPGAAWLTALAAADGRGAVLLDPHAPDDVLARHLQDVRVGAVFTRQDLCEARPVLAPLDTRPIVWLDDAPWSASVHLADEARRIDLGSHHGLTLVGDTSTDGLDEECLCIDGEWHSHRDLLRAARAQAERAGLTPRCEADWPAGGGGASIITALAVLLHGGRLHPAPA